MAKIRAKNQFSPHAQVEEEAVTLVLEKLRAQTQDDGDRFAGYAPVLEAVARTILEISNVSSFISDIKSGKQPITLTDVAAAILKRETGKLDSLDISEKTDCSKLYQKEEQLERICGRVYSMAIDFENDLDPDDAEKYARALETWVTDHPFLNGAVLPSSAVFGAMISAHAMKSQNGSLASVALNRELSKGSSANPFFAEFYQATTTSKDESVGPFVPAGHIGAIYSSIRASLAQGESANLSIEADEDAEDETALEAEVEITINRRDKDAVRRIIFSTDQTEVLRLGSHQSSILIDAPYLDVEIGMGGEVIFAAPNSIRCDKIRLVAEKIIVENASKNNEGSIVLLEAKTCEGDTITSVPALRGRVELALSWAGVKVHPWALFAVEPTPIEDPREDEALRRLSKFVVVFASHGQGRLAKFREKLVVGARRKSPA